MESFRRIRTTRRRYFDAIFQLVLLPLLASSGMAGDLAFRRHVISPESEYSAVAVTDVNHDGNLDVLCGGFWYEAPTWQRHFVRDVERIRGRFDGYAHLPMDVNGDGWTDVLTVNYRSRSIKWMQHPGADLGGWSIHTVEEPGPMETGRLFDIDGDGRMDVLPNGQQFAAWWELEPGTLPRWTRHELPIEVAGHGMGFGDIDGDGRGDAVGPRGWAAAPANPRRERWIWHPEFTLGRASVPVLVVDVDEDGDNDLVWTQAHGFGVYWMEQTETAAQQRRWIHHTIDSSWSQCHSPLWADMDGDGRKELVAGKRYMAHEGRDPGAYDPLVSYRYQFDPRTRTWQRWVISASENVGFGLDPKVVDLDADGDLDLVVCGRSGLYWMENEGPWNGHRPDTQPPTYDNHANLTIVRDPAGVERSIETPFDWGLRRSHILASIQQVLGPLPTPKDRVPLDVKVLRHLQVDGYSRQTVSYQAAAGRRVNANVWLQKNNISNAPGLIFLNLVTANDPSASNTDDSQTESMIRELAERGYVCIVPELSVPEEVASVRGTPASLKEGNVINDIWNCMRAVDLLESLPQVNRDRIGCFGSASSTPLALLTAVLDQRIVATWCSGEFAMVDVHPEAATHFSIPELFASISPRSLLLHVPPTAQRMEALEQAVQLSAPVYALNRRAQPPTIATGPLTDASNETRLNGYKWLDGNLKSRGSSGRPRRQQ